MMSSSEIVTLINALGTGSKDFNIENEFNYFNLKKGEVKIYEGNSYENSIKYELIVTFP